MRNHIDRSEQGVNPSIGGTHEKFVRHADLTELVLGPLSDQMEKMKWDILSAIQKVSESTEIIAREIARQVKRDD